MYRQSSQPHHAELPDRERRALNAVKYRCHKLRAELWDMDNRKDRMNANHWIVGHIGESFMTANLEELERLEFYMQQKIANGHCPLHIEENASTRYKRDGGSTAARKKVRERLVELHGEKCVDCGRDDVILTLDHIHPISLGGKNEVANCQLLCVPCHTKKTKTDSKIAFERYFAENFPEKLAAMKAAQEERRKAKEESRAMKKTGVSAAALSRMPDAPAVQEGDERSQEGDRPRRRRGRRGGRNRRPGGSATAAPTAEPS